jgi:sulfur carrier protein ThiS
VALNGERLDRSIVMEEQVKDGDRLQIFAVLGGG